MICERQVQPERSDKVQNACANRRSGSKTLSFGTRLLLLLLLLGRRTRATAYSSCCSTRGLGICIVRCTLDADAILCQR